MLSKRTSFKPPISFHPSCYLPRFSLRNKVPSSGNHEVCPHLEFEMKGVLRPSRLSNHQSRYWATSNASLCGYLGRQISTFLCSTPTVPCFSSPLEGALLIIIIVIIRWVTRSFLLNQSISCDYICVYMLGGQETNNRSKFRRNSIGY